MLKKPIKTLATQNYKTACDDLAKAFCKQIDVDYKDTWWAADEQGGVFCFLDGEMFTNCEDMVLAIEYGLTWHEFSEHYSYWASHEAKINLRSWIKGARPKDKE